MFFFLSDGAGKSSKKDTEPDQVIGYLGPLQEVLKKFKEASVNSVVGAEIISLTSTDELHANTSSPLSTQQIPESIPSLNENTVAIDAVNLPEKYEVVDEDVSGSDNTEWVQTINSDDLKGGAIQQLPGEPPAGTDSDIGKVIYVEEDGKAIPESVTLYVNTPQEVLNEEKVYPVYSAGEGITDDKTVFPSEPRPFPDIQKDGDGLDEFPLMPFPPTEINETPEEEIRRPVPEMSVNEATVYNGEYFDPTCYKRPEADTDVPIRQPISNNIVNPETGNAMDDPPKLIMAPNGGGPPNANGMETPEKESLGGAALDGPMLIAESPIAPNKNNEMQNDEDKSASEKIPSKKKQRKDRGAKAKRKKGKRQRYVVWGMGKKWA
jgi:hypothetical protein